MSNHPKPPKHQEQSSFDNIPPILSQNMTAKNYVEALKESRWNNDYQMGSFKRFLQADSLDDVVFADFTCPLANSLVFRYILPDFIKSKGLNIDRVIGIESDGEYAPSFSSIEISETEKVSRLGYGHYFISNDKVRYIIGLSEGYRDDYKFKFASRKDSVPDANAFLEEMKKYGEEHNFLRGKKIDPHCNFIKFDKKYDWSDLILPEKIKDDIRTNLLNLIESREIYRKNGLQVKRGLILSGQPGCHAKGTKILMYDGTTKNVEDVKVGDLLMGPDSTSREVLQLANGQETMYKIIPNKGESFVVNGHHILHLEFSGKEMNFQFPMNITVKDFLTIKPSVRNRLKLVRTGITFSKKDLSIPPYILGLWLGDGTSKETALTTMDQPIFDAWINYGKKLGLGYSIAYKGGNNKSITVRLTNGHTGYNENKFLDKLKNLNVLNNKHIPFEYLTSNEKDRLELLAGLIDTDGYADKTGGVASRRGRGKSFDYITKSEDLADNIVYLCRSLGFSASKKLCTKGCYIRDHKYFEGEYFRISIFGDVYKVPVLLKRKKCIKRIMNKDVRRVGFGIEKLSIDSYYGFALPKDHLYLTGDFTIHHNTGKSMLAKVLCNQVQWTLVWVTPKHLEGGARKIAQIVQLCKDLSPTIMLLEDIDLYGGDRATNHNPALLGEMMNQLDGVQENTDIITIATTNNKEVLETALLNRPGRFDKVVDFPLPNKNERLQMLKVFSNGLVDEALPFLNEVAGKESEKMTGAQVRELCNLAVIYAIDEKAYDANNKLLLTESHFKQAVKAVKGKDFNKITGFNPTGTFSPLGNRLDDICPDFDD
jgi:hypothetical protein